MARERRGIHWPKVGRDGTLLAIGAVGFLHEVWLTTSDRYSVIAGSLALMGLPFYLRADERREAKNGNGRPPAAEEPGT